MNLKLIMGSLLAASYQLPALAAAPSGVYIKKYPHNGTGCPSYSVGKDLSRDTKAFTLTFRLRCRGWARSFKTRIEKKLSSDSGFRLPDGLAICCHVF